MKHLSITQKVFIFCILLNLAVYGAYGFIYFSIRSQSTHAGALLAEADTDTQKNDALLAIKASLAQNQDFISQIDSFFIAPDGVVGFINSLEALGKQSGVAISISSVAVAPDSANTKDFKEDLKLKLDMSGSWSDIYYVLSQLENLPYRVVFDDTSITLSGADETIKFGDTPRVKGPDEVWNATFDIEVLKLAEPKS